MNDSENLTYEIFIHDFKSDDALEVSVRINIVATVIVVTIGLIGNSLTICVFGNRKFRKNSSHVYLLCLAINDSLFLIIHFFEDTVRTYRKMNEEVESTFIDILNITNRYQHVCLLINYIRNILRFVSAYVIVAFTLQRLSIVFRPLTTNFKSKKSAWKTVSIIILISFLVNSWVPFLFKIQSVQDNYQCDIRKGFQSEYFIIIILYTSLVMLVPILIVLISNSLIVYKTRKADSDRSELISSSSSMRSSFVDQPQINNKFEYEMIDKLTLRPVSQMRSSSSTARMSRTPPMYNNSHKLAHSLHLISFSYAFFNLPYLVSWFAFFYSVAFSEFNGANYSYLYAAVEICEIFYVFTFSMKFYVYCISGTNFRQQLLKTS